MVAAAGSVVGQGSVWTYRAGELQCTVAGTDVGVPVPVGSEDTAVLDVNARLGDALAAIQIEGSAWGTVFLRQLAPALARVGIPHTVGVAVDACAAFQVEL